MLYSNSELVFGALSANMCTQSECIFASLNLNLFILKTYKRFFFGNLNLVIDGEALLHNPFIWSNGYTKGNINSESIQQNQYNL